LDGFFRKKNRSAANKHTSTFKSFDFFKTWTAQWVCSCSDHGASINEEDQAMINLCRRHGSAAKLCGSGGSVLALMKCKEEWSALEVEAKGAGITVVEPQLFKEVS